MFRKNIIYLGFKEIKSLFIKCYEVKDFLALIGYIKCLKIKTQALFRRHSTICISMSPKVFSKKMSILQTPIHNRVAYPSISDTSSTTTIPEMINTTTVNNESFLPNQIHNINPSIASPLFHDFQGFTIHFYQDTYNPYSYEVCATRTLKQKFESVLIQALIESVHLLNNPVLILDKDTFSILNTITNIDELVNYGFYTVDLLENIHRKRYPCKSAVYLIENDLNSYTMNSSLQVIHDLANTVTYDKIIINFVTHPSNMVIKTLNEISRNVIIKVPSIIPCTTKIEGTNCLIHNMHVYIFIIISK